MQWKTRPQINETYSDRKGRWHKKFLWLPQDIDGVTYWLCWCNRIGQYHRVFSTCWWTYKYFADRRGSNG